MCRLALLGPRGPTTRRSPLSRDRRGRVEHRLHAVSVLLLLVTMSKRHMECIAAVCPPHTSFGSPGECQPQGKGQDLHVPLLYCMYGRHDSSIRLLAHFGLHIRRYYTFGDIVRMDSTLVCLSKVSSTQPCHTNCLTLFNCIFETGSQP